MTDQTNDDGLELLEFTSDIVAAYVAHNALSSSDLPKLIADVHLALKTLGTDIAPALDEPQKAAVSVRKSVTPDYLICLEDGKKFKSLKRHLLQLGMTPAQYREKWKLPPDYPMVAPNYSATRSALAKSLGLGRKPASVAAPRKSRQPAAS